MDGTILDTEPTHRKAWDQVLAQYGMTYYETAIIGLNGSPTWRIAQVFIADHQSYLEPHRVAAEKSALLNDAIGYRLAATAD